MRNENLKFLNEIISKYEKKHPIEKQSEYQKKTLSDLKKLSSDDTLTEEIRFNGHPIKLEKKIQSILEKNAPKENFCNRIFHYFESKNERIDRLLEY